MKGEKKKPQTTENTNSSTSYSNCRKIQNEENTVKEARRARGGTNLGHTETQVRIKQDFFPKPFQQERDWSETLQVLKSKPPPPYNSVRTVLQK